MALINRDDVERAVALARLSLSEEALVRMVSELDRLLGYVHLGYLPGLPKASSVHLTTELAGAPVNSSAPMAPSEPMHPGQSLGHKNLAESLRLAAECGEGFRT